MPVIWRSFSFFSEKLNLCLPTSYSLVFHWLTGLLVVHWHRIFHCISDSLDLWLTGLQSLDFVISGLLVLWLSFSKSAVFCISTMLCTSGLYNSGFIARPTLINHLSFQIMLLWLLMTSWKTDEFYATVLPLLCWKKNYCTLVLLWFHRIWLRWFNLTQLSLLILLHFCERSDASKTQTQNIVKSGYQKLVGTIKIRTLVTKNFLINFFKNSKHFSFETIVSRIFLQIWNIFFSINFNYSPESPTFETTSAL